MLAPSGHRRIAPASTGGPGYDPRDLLKLYIYGYLNEVRSSRRLERECKRNVEVMWLIRRLAPDHKTIADFRRDNGAAIVGACRAFVSGAFPAMKGFQTAHFIWFVSSAAAPPCSRPYFSKAERPPAA